MRPTGSAADLEARRRRAVKLLDEGWKVSDVMAAVGASRAAVYGWKKAAGSRGAAAKALAAKAPHRNECRLSKQQQAKLRRLLRAGPRKAGFETDLWTLARVTMLIQQEFGIVYHRDHVGRILHKLGFSCQKPTRRSKEQDPAAVKEWREKTWPAIKKGRKRSS